MKRRGSTLATLLLVFTLLTTLAFAVAYRFIGRQRFSRSYEYGTQAESLARSGIALAVARVKADVSFGTTGEVLNVTMPHAQDSTAGFYVTFDASAGPSVSYNNVRGDAPVPAASPVCPPGGLYVVSSGHVNGVTRVLRALIAIPPFKYAIASSGAIRSQGGLVLGSVPAGFDAATGSLDVAALEPAELMTAGQDDASGAALQLHGRSVIVGNARSAGSVDADRALVEVREGDLLANAEVDDIPDIDLSTLDFTSDPNTQRIPTSDFASAERLSGLLQWSPSGGESLHFRQGLHLNGATLRVRGNLVIDGELSGSGALLVDGNVTIRGGSSLSADNKVAVLSQGSVSITGRGQGSSYVQGIVYAAGQDGIRLQDVTVVGTVLNNGKAPGGGGAPMVVERAGVVFEKGVTNFEVDLRGDAGDHDDFNGARLREPLPLSTFYRNGKWDVPSNGRTGVTPENPYGLSPLELALLPHMEFLIDRTWYASPEEALAAGLRPATVASAVRKSAAEASLSYEDVLTRAAGRGAPEGNSSVRFSLDLNRYLKTEGRLRVVWMSP